MTQRLVSALVLTAAVLAVSGQTGCGKRKLPEPDNKPLDVDVAYPVVKDVVEFLDFTGRLDSTNPIDVRPRVTGFIVETPFKEGDIVTEKTVLFRIDDRQYKSKWMDTEAQVDLAKAKLKKAKADNSYAKETAKTPGAISKQDISKYQAAEEEGDAALKAATAQRDLAKQNYDWCTVRAETKVTGRVGRYLQTKGNLVNQDSTLLTTIIPEDPIYVYFDADERSLLKVRRGLESGRVKQNERGDIPIYMALADEVGFPHKGGINFVNNRIDPLTGTITVRGSFANPPGKAGRRLFSPGMFVRVRIPMGEPQRSVLVAERCLVTDQGLKNVFVVDEGDKVQYRRVELGPQQPDGLRVILDGLKGKEKVLLTGLQMVRTGMEVGPNVVPMPVLSLDRETRRQGDKETRRADDGK
jgi:multidrug efflux system membrane fusion protein